MKMERILVVWLVWAAMVVAELQGSSGCLEKERMGLVALGKSYFNLTHLSSDCCSWPGVNCSATTGRVQRLNFLPSSKYPLTYYILNISLLLPFEELLELKFISFDGLINQQDLIKLTRLETLSMRYGNLTNNVPLQAFANIKNLKYLDLIYNNMNIDLKGICKMNNIVELDLSSNLIRGHLPPCIGNLTHLQVLNLDFNQISGNIPSTIGNLSHLSYLNLGENYFSGPFSLHLLANNSKIEFLDLSRFHNDFHLETETHSWFPSFQLKQLALTSCNLNKMSNSVIPTFLLYQFNLWVIELDDNNLQDTFPSWLLQNNSKLGYLSMSNNSLTGNLIIPDNLQVFSPALHHVQISKNRLQGNLPSSFGAMNELGYLDLSFNSLSGVLPYTLFVNNSFLFYVDLSNNLLHGEISLNSIIFPSLNTLLLRNNKFTGIFEELPNQSPSQLRVFDVSDNLMSAKLSNLIVNFPFLEVFKVSNNYLEGGIPDNLCHLRKLDHLDISHNNLSGSIPPCFRTLSLRFLYMRNCSLSGAIPVELSINSTLEDIDLSYNHFSPGIPPNWIYSQDKLQILLMAGVQLVGEISTRICELENIQIMDLSHNSFNGTIPSCLFTRPFWVAESQFNYSYTMSHIINAPINPSSQEIFEVEFTTKGTSRRFKGEILNFMNGLDLSSNQLSGQIPPQIGDSKAIHAMNLSNNRLWGSIPSSISRLRDIESLDFSSNNLCGGIPSEIVRRNFLSIFNVSNNNLPGPIPIGGQFSNFDERNYGGNELLCGPRLPRLCTSSASPTATLPDEKGNDDETMFDTCSFWWSFISGYVALIISVVVIVGTDTRCSRVWFRSVDVVSSKLFSVFTKVKSMLGIK